MKSYLVTLNDGKQMTLISEYRIDEILARLELRFKQGVKKIVEGY